MTRGESGGPGGQDPHLLGYPKTSKRGEKSVGLYTPTILGGNFYLSWFYDRVAIKDPAHTGTSKGLPRAINRGPIRNSLPKYANVYVTIQSRGLSAGARTHYGTAYGVETDYTPLGHDTDHSPLGLAEYDSLFGAYCGSYCHLCQYPQKKWVSRISHARRRSPCIVILFRTPQKEGNASIPVSKAVAHLSKALNMVLKRAL